MTEKEMYDRINGTSQDTGFSINEKARGLDGTFAALMRKVYVWMTLALVITGFTAYSVANSPALLNTIYTNSALMWGLIIGELALVFIISGAINRLSLTTATLLFIIYSVLNGAMLSSIFIIYEPMVIAKVFFITAGTFGAMAFYGYSTKRDLTQSRIWRFIGSLWILGTEQEHVYRMWTYPKTFGHIKTQHPFWIDLKWWLVTCRMRKQ